LDGTLGGSNPTSTTAPTPTLTTTNAKDVVVAAINYPINVTSTLRTGRFASLTNFNGSTTVHGRAAYAVTTSAGAQQAIWDLTGSSSSGTAILALKAA
jgi:hypothetical protein